MFKFFKESIKEFEHVVWPTTNETKKYFYIVVGIITGLTILLFIAGSIFSKTLFVAKNAVNPSIATPTTNSQNTNASNDFDLSKLNINSGSLNSTGSNDTGSTIEILPTNTGSINTTTGSTK